MPRNQTATANEALARQAIQMRREFPELFAYLAQRDAMLQRALSRVPHEADVELSAVPRPGLSIEAAIHNLDPGIAVIAG